MIYKIPVLLLGMLFPLVYSSYAEDAIVTKSFSRISYETLTIPDDQEMSIVGVNFLFNSDIGFYYGFGAYGAVNGNRGGFFTGGLELGYQQPLFKNIVLDLGFFGGGGGGGRAPKLAGLMLRPHAGLLYNASSWKMGIAYSGVKFTNANSSSKQIALESDQVVVQLEVPFETVFSNEKDSQALHKLLHSYEDEHTFGWVDHYFAAIFQAYFPSDDTKNASGSAYLGDLALIGVEFGSYFNEQWFGFMEASGAMEGGSGGYAEVLGGLGYDYTLSRKAGVKAKLSLGSAGGGSIDTGGGFVYKANAGAYYKPFEQLTIEAEAGYLETPNGHFKAQTGKLSFIYNLTSLETGAHARCLDASQEITTGEWNLRIVNQNYLLSDVREEKSVQLIGLKLDRYFGDNFYITGQAYGSYSGGADGYASGLIGPAYRTKRFFEKLALYLELLGGTGASGGVNSEDGAVVQAMAGVNYAMFETLGLQVGIGEIRSVHGNFNATAADIGFVYKFGTIEKK